MECECLYLLTRINLQVNALDIVRIYLLALNQECHTLIVYATHYHCGGWKGSRSQVCFFEVSVKWIKIFSFHLSQSPDLILFSWLHSQSQLVNYFLFFFFFFSAQLSLTDEQFPVDEELGRGSLTTSVSDLATEARQIAQVTMCTFVWDIL